MKVPQCDCAPSLVVEWLSGELEDRGIPGPVYAHTLLSLLHCHYCPHPPLTPPEQGGIRVHPHALSRLNHLHHLLDDLPHPDADLPDLTTITALKCGGSRRARKRFRVRQKQRIFTSEELQKVAALQCLMSACDEDLQNYDLENLIDELCTRLKLSKEGPSETTTTSTGGGSGTKPCQGSEESGNDTDDSTPEQLAQKYFAAFPPLSETSMSNLPEVTTWKPLEGEQPLLDHCWVRETEETYWKKCAKKKRKGMFHKSGDDSKSAKSMESSVEKCTNVLDLSEFGDPVDNQNKADICLKGVYEATADEQARFRTYVEEDIPEGYIGDTSSRESSEDRDKSDNLVANKKYNGNKMNVVLAPENQLVSSKPGSCEEWECTATTGSSSGNPSSSIKSCISSGTGGARLFERCNNSGGTSGCSSDGETTASHSTPIIKENDRDTMENLERKISDTVAQVWGMIGSGQLKVNKSDHVWDPPTVCDLASVNSSEIYMSRPSSGQLTNLLASSESQFDAQMFCSGMAGSSSCWPGKNSLFQNSVSDAKEDSLFSSAFSYNPNHLLKNLDDVNNINDQYTLADHDANETKDKQNDSKTPTENVTIGISDHSKMSYDDEVNLGKSFQQYGLNQLWGDDNGLDIMFSELSIGNSDSKSKQSPSGIDTLYGDCQGNLVSYESENLPDFQQRSDIDMLARQIPSGPSGPHPDLKHTESSGFSTVVPRGKSAELVPPDHISLSLNKSNSTSSSSIPANFPQESTANDLTLPTTEEENLLTSPRTHFKPIRQDSTGKRADGTDESNTIGSGFQHPELPFQRTGSGALFLESDLLEGSPKKYMVYREPPCKIFTTEDSEPVTVSETLVSLPPLVPKFKVVNNEKFSQTEVNQSTQSERLAVRKHTSMSRALENFKFDKDCFAGLSNIWKGNCTLPNTADNIWQLPCESKEEMWSKDHPAVNKLVPTSWLKDISHLESWSTRDQFDTTDGGESTSKGIDIPRDNNGWSQCDGFEGSYCTESSSFAGMQSLWSEVDDTDLVSSTGKESRVVGSSVHTSGAETPVLSFLPFGSASEKKLWGPQKPDLKLDETSLWPSFSLDQKDTSSLPPMGFDINRKVEGDSKTASSANVDENGKDSEHLLDALFSKDTGDDNPKAFIPSINRPFMLSQTSWEKDDKPEVYPSLWSINKLGDSSLSSGQQEEQINDSSDHNFWNLMEPYNRKMSGELPIPSVNKGMDDEPDLQFLLSSLRDTDEQDLEMDQLGHCTQIPLEDLDHLEPGWELNEGFEWDQPLEDMDSDDGTCEVYVVKCEDGQTIHLPVEYLDDSIYDEIFGSMDKPIGRSLPDLPSGNYTQRPIPRWLPPWRRPCSFFMEGNCKRPDCKFSHDLASITCRFWEEGSCLKGMTCPFLHGYPLRRQRNKSEGSASVVETDRADNMESLIHASAFEINSEADFPSLSSSVESKRTTLDDGMCLPVVTSSASVQCTSATNKSKKKSKFITITRNIIGEDKSSERTCKFIRRRAWRRQRRIHHNSETDPSDRPPEIPSDKGVNGGAQSKQQQQQQQQPEKKKPMPAVLKRLEKHRSTASGHEDGTMSDY